MSVVRRCGRSARTALLLSALLLMGAQGAAQASPAETTHVDVPRKVGFGSAGLHVTQIEAGWTVPHLDCDVTPNAAATILIAMGEAGAPATASIGITADCIDRGHVYTAWYQIPGRDRTTCAGVPQAGDQIAAKMDAIRNVYLSMTLCGSIMTDREADNLSWASIVVEATRIGAGHRIQRLTDFGTVYMTEAKVNNVSIGAQDTTNWRMVGPDGTVRAVTAGLHDDGSFAINWRAAR